ncbi:MAG: PDZ domain-containing protein, partial [Polyangiaceae bacterium]
VAVSAAAFAALTADGRKQLTAGGVQTTSGTSVASYARAKTISVGAAQASGVVVLHDDSFDGNLATITGETGETIDGSLGGTFLEHFDLTIDYPGKKLHLAPYQDTSFIVDPAELVGFALGTSVSTGYAVASVFSGSDAEAKGVAAGDIVTAVDGQSIASLSTSQIAVLMGGPVGSTKSVTFGAAKSLANQSVDIKVEELLPLPK